jgi:hypothetical protein
MGQYHIVYNITKREYIHAHRINNGLKLLEQVGWPKSTSTALFLLLANSNGRGGGDAQDHPVIGRWAGDRIVVQGDYAEIDDAAYLPEEETDTFTDISEGVMQMLDHCVDFDWE